MLYHIMVILKIYYKKIYSKQFPHNLLLIKFKKYAFHRIPKNY